MPDRMSHAAHARAALALGLPLIGSQVAQYGIGMTDTLMLGHYGVDALAAGTLGSTVFFVVLLAGSGFAFAVMPMVAEALGHGDERAARRVTRMGVWASVAYGAALTPVLVFSEPLLRLLGQPAEVAALAGGYLRIAGWALVPGLIGFVLRSHLAAHERTRIVLVATLVTLAVNAALNWVLIFGRLGFPELGVRGAAIASLTVQLTLVGMLVVHAARVLPGPPLLERVWRVDGEVLARVVRVGWPIGLTNLAEVSLFAASAFMMGWLGTVALAAHGIAIQLAGLAFMVHLGLSQAATVRAGTAFGRHDPLSLARGGRAVMALSVGVSVVAGVIFVAVPETLLGLFLGADDSDRTAILSAGVALLLVAAVFQLADGAQVVALGLLRGVQDTAVPMVIAAFSYWVVGIPTAYSLGFVAGLGGVGVWLGLVVGLMAAAGLLLLRFWGAVLPRAAAPA
jgi:MATE family multidrug resistance protein